MVLRHVVRAAVLMGITFLVIGTIYMVTTTLSPKSAFDEQLPLLAGGMLEVSEVPACTPAMPSLACYYGGLGEHAELKIMYSSSSVDRVLISFKLPDR